MRDLTASSRLPPFPGKGCETLPMRSQRRGFQVLTPQLETTSSLWLVLPSDLMFLTRIKQGSHKYK